MIVTLTHPFIRRCINRQQLLKDCNKFNTFTRRMKKQAEIAATDGEGEIDEDIQNKYKGDAFELFVEVFIRIFGADMLIGIDPQSYSIVPPDKDQGVDGVGIGFNGDSHTVQAKFRQSNYVLTSRKDDLKSLTNQSMKMKEDNGFSISPSCKFKVDFDRRGDRSRIDNTCQMTVSHCGKEIHRESKKDLVPLREINRKDIRRRVEQNNIFWDSFRESWDEAIRDGE